MDFKKLFINNKAVSPVIGVILMVAITVILAAAIGASVFGHGTAQSAPQANFDIKSSGTSNAYTGVTAAGIKIEHLGGDPIHFGDASVTKVTASLNGNNAVEIESVKDYTTNPAGTFGTIGVGDIKAFPLVKKDSSPAAAAFTVASGDTVNIKIIDVKTNQLICDKNVRF